jgi:hypothetical protein
MSKRCISGGEGDDIPLPMKRCKSGEVFDASSNEDDDCDDSSWVPSSDERRILATWRSIAVLLPRPCSMVLGPWAGWRFRPIWIS